MANHSTPESDPHLDLESLDPQVRSVLQIATDFLNHHTRINYPDEAPLTLEDWFADAAPSIPDPPALILDSYPPQAHGRRMVSILGDPYHSEGGPVQLTAWFDEDPPDNKPDWVVFDFDTVAQLIWTECSSNLYPNEGH